MTSAVEEVARNAVSTSEASKNATTSAGDGRDLVQETVGAIERMSADVQKYRDADRQPGRRIGTSAKYWT